MAQYLRLLVFGFCMLAVSAQAGNTSAQANNGSPLHEAAERGDKARVEALLAKGADVNAKDPNGWTPLHRAVDLKRKDVAVLLLANGADVKAKTTNGWTALHMVAESGTIDMADWLLANGADITAKIRNGWTPLHVSVSYGNKDIVKLLLAKGADVNAEARDDNPGAITDGWTPLHLATDLGIGRKDIIELLLANGADINAQGIHVKTPLSMAESKGDKDLIELLLAKATINVKDKDGNTAQGLANFAAFSRSTYEPVWTRNSRRALELSAQAEQLAKAGDKLGSWRAMTEAVQLSPDDPLLLRDFCHSSFDVGRYRDVVWSAQTLVEKFREDRWLFGGAAMQYEWGISLAVLGEYEQAAQVLRTGLERFPSGEWGDGFREWSIVLTYLNKDFIAAREEARAHPVAALGGSVHNGTVWNLLAKRIQNLSGMADKHKMQYPLLDHLSQLHRLIRDGIEKGYLSFETPEFKTKLGKFSRDLAWRTIMIYQSLPVRPLPPAVAVEKARRALNVIATEPEYNWERAIQDLMDVTRRVPWWAEAHYNVAVLFENRTFGGNWGDYYDYSDFVRSGSPNNRTIAAQEYMFCVAADPHGSKADAARKMLREWDQPIPN